MMIQYFDHNFSYIYHLLLHIYVLHDIFHLWFLFQTWAAYRYQFIILTLFLSFLNKLAMLIRALIKNEQDQIHIFQCTFFFLSVQTLFEHVCSLYQWCLLDTIRCKKLFNLVMMLHRIFSSYPCIHMDKHPFLTTKQIY